MIKELNCGRCPYCGSDNIFYTDVVGYYYCGKCFMLIKENPDEANEEMGTQSPKTYRSEKPWWKKIN